MAVSVTFLTPLAALVGLGVALPFLVLFGVRRRAGRIRHRLGLSEPSRRRLLIALAALLTASALVGLAAAQPVLEQRETRRLRTDAEVFVVIDVSRSMLAQENSESPMRIDRAKAVARALRASLSDVPVGIASLTDRALPHLFPSSDEKVFEATLERSIGIERPPPSSGFLSNATRLDALAAVRTRRFFSPSARHRLLVVLTDGESLPVANARLGTLMRQAPAIETVFVQVWGKEERVFTRGAAEPQYQSDPSARALLERLAASTRGFVYSEGDVGLAEQKARGLLGRGPTVVQGQSGSRTPLASYLAAAALLPLGLFLRRRDR